MSRFQALQRHWLLLFVVFVIGGALGGLLVLPEDLGRGSSQSLFGIGLTIDLIRFGLGVVLVYLLLRLRDVVLHLDFRDLLSHVLTEPVGGAIYFGAWIIGLFLFAGQVMAQPAPTTYDNEIRGAAELWLPDASEAHGWEILKAQYWQESRLDPAAVSPVGAAGIAQFMPATWAEISRRMQFGAISPHIAGPAIEAGAAYMAQLRGGWSAPRPEWDRHSLALASYNAGFGHLLAAQQVCGDARGYAAIVACLPQVTGRHSAETSTYVRSIWQFHLQMRLGAL